MFDTHRALADMANQIRACRSADGLTLQQLASRSGVAASTIHKVEARQMVPTVSVLLKIAKGLGRRPEELIRDGISEPLAGEEPPTHSATASPLSSTEGAPQSINGAGTSVRFQDTGLGTPQTAAQNESAPRPSPSARPDIGVWQIEISPERGFPALELDPHQRAIVLVERGGVDLQAGDQRVQMDAGDCIEVEGGRIQSVTHPQESATLKLIVSPSGSLDLRLGKPRPSTPVFI